MLQNLIEREAAAGRLDEGTLDRLRLDGGGLIVAHSPGAISRTSLEQGIAQAIGGAAR